MVASSFILKNVLLFTHMKIIIFVFIICLSFFFFFLQWFLHKLHLLSQTPRPACGVLQLSGGWAAIAALPSLPFCSWPPCWSWPSLSFTSPGRGRWKTPSFWLAPPGTNKLNYSLLLTYYINHLLSVLKKHVFKLKLVEETQLCLKSPNVSLLTIQDVLWSQLDSDSLTKVYIYWTQPKTCPNGSHATLNPVKLLFPVCLNHIV